MEILIGWLSPLRTICMAIDGIAFSLLDDAYNIVLELAGATLLDNESLRKMMVSLYILFGIVAFFRLALVLINSVIDPDKLTEKGKGLGNIFFRVVGMILILAVAPLIFDFSYEVQKLMVGKPNVITGDDNPYGNVIFQMFLGDNANISGEDDNGYNAGKQLQNIVLSSFITIDDRYLVSEGDVCTLSDNGQVFKDGSKVYDTIDDAFQGNKCGYIPAKCISTGNDGECQMQGGYVPDTSNGKCDWDNCKEAVALYNQMYVQNDMSPSKLSTKVGVSADLPVEGSDDEEDVYVYNYMFIVTTILGVFITFVILSFAVDIAIRMFELVVLQITAPLFIATFVDPKAAQSGPFKNWLSAVGKSYVSLYIRLLILALMILLINVINQSNIFDNMGSVATWAKLFVIIALLIFVKKAPKWISELLGIKSDGLGGLWSPSKLKDSMIGGAMLAGAANKAIRGTAAGTTALARGAGNHLRNKKFQRQGIVDKELGDSSSRRKARQSSYKDNGLFGKEGYFSTLGKQMKDKHGAIKEAKKSGEYKGVLSGEAFRQGIVSMVASAGSGIKAGLSADNLKVAITQGKLKADDFKTKVGMGGLTTAEKIKQSAGNFGEKQLEKAFGNAYERQEKIDAITKAKNEIEWHKDGHGINSKKAFGDAIKINGGKIAGNEEDAFVVMGAKKAGISADAIAYDNDGNLTINGNAISANDRNSYINSITSNLTDSGFAHYAEMFNNVQSNSSSEYQNNMQQMQQMSLMMGTLQDTISKSINGIGDKFKSIGDSFKDFTKSGLSFNTSDGSLKVDLGDGKDIKVTAENLSNGEFMKALKDADSEKAEYFEKNDGLISDLKTFAENKDAEYDRIAPFITQYQNSVNEYSKYNARQEQLRPIIQGAKYIVDTSTGRITGEDSSATTLSGIENKFSREASKIKEKLDFIEQKQKNNNDSGS